MSKKINIQEIKNKIITIQNELNHVLLELDVALGLKSADALAKARAEGEIMADGETRIVEGVFDGQGMIGPDGKKYPVPANYASKSKLIEGDMLKLTIQPDGTFLFKQIGPIERERIVGVLAFDDNEKQFFGVANGKSYMLITAAVTYYKGEVGDEVIMLIPEEGTSQWAAVENIVKQMPVSETAEKHVETQDFASDEEDEGESTFAKATVDKEDHEDDEFKLE